ncbi:Glutamate decarboxylase 1 [Holothuria leucospilota]|uniref:Glutamate decarboxylase 1 n=1 Tax=Holothuria leucospilota TaxID=206669 RepID=A0A9Q1BZT6_HOLLE|nr:Glutamate decarboxylase 1 [Holothuria leucospilota]
MPHFPQRLALQEDHHETSVEEEEEEENETNDECSNDEGSESIPPTPTTPSSRQTRLARLFQERRRLVGRTVSEGQLLAKPIANGREKSKEAEDTPDFYEHRAKAEVMKDYWLRHPFLSLWALRSTPYSADLLPYKGGEGLTHKFLEEIVKIILEYIDDTFDRSSRVLEFHHPHDLKEKLHLELPEKPENLDRILDDCRKTLQYCVKTGHPRFFNQLSTGLDIVSLAGHWVTTTANTNMFTYEIAPVFTLVEKATLKKMRELIGYTDGDGGAISNLYAVLTARHKHVPSCKRRGLNNLPTLVMFTGKIILEDLENKVQQAIARGDKPFFVSATAGSTVVGAYDPLNGIADICEKYGLWFHVDAAWGGGVILSRKHRHLVDGIHSYLADRIRSKDAFELVFEKPECTNVCFWYYPPSLRELEDGQEKQLRLHKIAPMIKGRMMNEGRLMVGYQPLDDKVNFFRWVVSNPAASKHDVDYMLDEIERLGQDL